MANLGKIVYLSKAQKDELFSEGTVTSNGTTIVYNANDLYITPDGSVEDVQINNTSIIANGVANIPLAGSSVIGAVKINSSIGIAINSSGELYINRASDAAIKNGNNQYAPIVPYNQHQSIFYGLAQAAGDSTQSQSSNAVGSYTDEAKIAIQKMLGIYQAPWELIREETYTNATEADHEITVDSNGNSFQLTDIIMAFELPQQETQAKKGTYGQIHYYYNDSNNFLGPEAGGWTQEANAAARGFHNFIQKQGDLIIYSDSSQTTTSNSGNNRYRYGAGLTGSMEAIQIIPNFYIHKINIKTVTGTAHYKLYGKRKWT